MPPATLPGLASTLVRRAAGAAQGTMRVLLITAALTAPEALAAEPAPLPADKPPQESVRLPDDDGAHPDWKTEWWYVTGWLDDAGGAPRGFQVTFFRNRGPADASHQSRFAPHQILLAHAAVSDPAVGHIVHEERMDRAGFQMAEARTDTLDVHIGDWRLQRTSDGLIHATVHGHALDLDLSLRETQPPMLQGEQGYSRKGHDPHAFSWYYSLPQLQVEGTLRNGGQAAVTVRGTAWIDHEWSNAYISDNAVGWDWTGLNFSDGAALMAFRMRDPHGHTLWSSGTWRDAAGRVLLLSDGVVSFEPGRIWVSPLTGAKYPVEWTLRWPGHDLRISPLFDDQEMDTRASTATAYWEGAVLARPLRGVGGQGTGGAESAPVARGYLELTGYWKPLLF